MIAKASGNTMTKKQNTKTLKAKVRMRVFYLVSRG
jgi:hypothetical protein